MCRNGANSRSHVFRRGSCRRDAEYAVSASLSPAARPLFEPMPAATELNREARLNRRHAAILLKESSATLPKLGHDGEISHGSAQVRHRRQQPCSSAWVEASGLSWR